MRSYTEQALDVLNRRTGDPAIISGVQHLDQLLSDMTSGVRDVADAGSPVLIPLTNTLNEIGSAQASHIAARQDRIPPTIVLLLLVATLVSSALVGWQHSTASEMHPLPSLAFMLQLSSAIYVTLDSNQPQRGLIRVDTQPFDRLLASMK